MPAFGRRRTGAVVPVPILFNMDNVFLATYILQPGHLFSFHQCPPSVCLFEISHIRLYFELRSMWARYSIFFRFMFFSALSCSPCLYLIISYFMQSQNFNKQKNYILKTCMRQQYIFIIYPTNAVQLSDIKNSNNLRGMKSFTIFRVIL